MYGFCVCLCVSFQKGQTDLSMTGGSDYNPHLSTFQCFLHCPSSVEIYSVSVSAFRFHFIWFSACLPLSVSHLKMFSIFIIFSLLLSHSVSHLHRFVSAAFLLIFISVFLLRDIEFFHPLRWKKARQSCMGCIWLESHCVCWLMSGSVGVFVELCHLR